MRLRWIDSLSLSRQKEREELPFSQIQLERAGAKDKSIVMTGDNGEMLLGGCDAIG